MSTVTTTRQHVTVIDVSDVEVTEIVEDDGEFVRAIRVYTTEGANAAVVFEMTIRGATMEAIKVTAPEQEF